MFKKILAKIKNKITTKTKDHKNVYFWLQNNKKHWQNFGDFLNLYLMYKLFGYPKVKDSKTMYTFIGSTLCNSHIDNIFSLGYNKIHFYSCGLRKDKLSDDHTALSEKYLNDKRTNIIGTRGHLSAATINKPCIGDAALLLPLIYEKPKTVTQYSNKNVFIPHCSTLKPQEVAKNTGCDIALDIKIDFNLDDVEDFINKLTSAKFVLTASLHGAIVAYAYGIDFAFYNSKEEIDCPFKWDDFASTFGKKAQFSDNINEALSAKYSHNLSKFNISKLIEKAPFKISQQILNTKIQDKWNICLI